MVDDLDTLKKSMVHLLPRNFDKMSATSCFVANCWQPGSRTTAACVRVWCPHCRLEADRLVAHVQGVVLVVFELQAASWQGHDKCRRSFWLPCRDWPSMCQAENVMRDNNGDRCSAADEQTRTQLTMSVTTTPQHNCVIETMSARGWRPELPHRFSG